MPSWINELGVGGWVAAAIAGFWAFRSSRPSKSKDAADLVTAAASFQSMLQKTAETLVADLRKEITDLRDRVDELEVENERCRGEAEALRQDGRQMQQKIASLMSVLRNGGIDLPDGPLGGAVVELRDDTVTVLTPRKSRRTRSAGQ